MVLSVEKNQTEILNKTNPKYNKTIISIIAIIFTIIITCVISMMSILYPNNSIIQTSVGEIDIGLKTIDTATEEISVKLNGYVHIFTLSDGEQKEVPISEVIYNIDKDKIKLKLKGYNKLPLWFKQDSINLDLSDCVEYNSEKVLTLIKDINEKNSDNIIEAQNAYITYNSEKNEYEIVPAVYSNVILEDSVETLISYFKTFDTEGKLVELGCYVIPEILEDNSDLLSSLNVFNELKDFNLVYTFNGIEEKLDLATIGSWISPNYTDGVILNTETPFIISEDLVNNYVLELNKKYTTIGTSRSFTNSYGNVMTISGGDYGWILDRRGMQNSIIEHIQNRQSETLDGLFTQRGASFGTNDFSNSYVEVSIDNQRLWMYVNGNCIINTPVVTGDIVKQGRATHRGVFSLTYKTKNAVLRGEDYETPVNFWMPFDGGIGLHDATWRSNFGGSIYKGNGSHGCVNMPYNAAKTAYENINSTMPIIVW